MAGIENEEMEADAPIVGGGSDDRMRGTAGDDAIFGEGGNDRIAGRDGDDRIHGGGGDDRLIGNAGNDTIFGAATLGGSVDMDKFRIGEDVEGTVTFMGETAGYKNALGMYKIAADGTIYDVEMLFANASLKGSGGSLVGGESSVDISLSAGDRIAFFVVPNGYSQSGMAKLLSDPNGSFRFIGPEGEPGNVNGGSEVRLVHTSEDGTETVVRSQYGQSVFHSTEGSEGGLNRDGMQHVTAEVDVNKGVVTIGFEDLMGGGDKDFDDSIFQIDIGTTNAALLPKVSTKESTSTDNDTILGGTGEDKLFGMSGDDIIKGGADDDKIWGNSGNDKLFGGRGDDEVRGGSGDDIMKGGAGNDLMFGNSGDDILLGGSGNDELWGNSGNDIIADGGGHDKVDGGSGDDTFVAGAGNDYYNGGSGFDTIDYSNARVAITADMSKHWVSGYGQDEIWSVEGLTGSSFDDNLKGDKRDNVLNGAAGDDFIRGMGGSDTLTGGEGSDTFMWAAKDIIDEETGEHLGVDTITDFSEGDRLDFSRILKGQDFESIRDVVDVRDGDNGVTVAVKIGERFVDVVNIEGVTAGEVYESFDVLG